MREVTDENGKIWFLIPETEEEAEQVNEMMRSGELDRPENFAERASDENNGEDGESAVEF